MEQIMQCAARAGVALSPWDVVENGGQLTIDGMDAYRWIAAAMQGRTPVAQQQYEDVIVERAADLYRQWEARHADPYGHAEPDQLRSRPAHAVRCVGAPWHARLKDRIRGAWCRFRITR